MEMYNLIATIGEINYDIVVKDVCFDSNCSVLRATQIGDFNFGDFDITRKDYYHACPTKKIIITGAPCILLEYHGKPHSNIRF